MRLPIRPFVTLIAITMLATATHAQEVEVTSCGDVVPDRATGYLTADLDCSGFTGGPANVYAAGAAVYLGTRSKLDLRGFTLTAGQHGVLCNNISCGVNSCARRTPCDVFNGAINGTEGFCVGGEKPRVDDVTITGCGQGIYAYQRVELSNSTVTGSTYSGVVGGITKVINCSVTGNGEFGVSASQSNVARAKIYDSVVTGNALWSACGTIAICGDVFSRHRPRVSNTTCDASVAPTMFNPSGTWGLCAAD